ncbi:MAG: amino acid racemase [Candidatus Magasanikbacteria bacterium]
MKKIIGILGGMGPSVSAEIYKQIIKTAQKKYHAKQDTDFPPMFIYSLPLAGFNETGFTNSKQVKNQLISGVKKLETAGSDFIIITCNTVHYFLKDMRAAINIPIISIIEETVKKVKSTKQKYVGVISSQSTNQLKLYEKTLSKNNIKTISPNTEMQKKINKIILKIMSGQAGLKEKKVLIKIIEYLQNLGAQSIVLGCTELPLLINQKDIKITLFNSNEILIQSALKNSLGK